jgi:outer membrane protein assembly factor BamA
MVGLVYLSKKKGLNFEGKPIPPDLSVVGGAFTENGTWAGILVHQAYWKQDRIRFMGVTGYLSPNLAIYREGPLGDTKKFGFNLRGPLFMPSLSFRIKNSNSFLGANYVFMNNSVTFDLPIEDVPVERDDLKSTLSGLGILYMFDSRDNTFTPNKGIYSNVSVVLYDNIFGSSQEYTRLDSYIVGFQPLGNRFILGGRFDYRAAFNDPPFYALPFADLRGVPAFRYQGRQLLILETEERWDFSNRWSLTAFAGVGKGFENLQNFDEEDWAYSLGGGFRYLMARKFNIYTGIDIARGPEDWAFYIQFGHYWNRL